MQLELIDQRPLRFSDGAPVHAASTVTRLGDGWLVAQDDAEVAAWWRGDRIERVSLVPGARGVLPKDTKPDFESSVSLGADARRALVFGSGSRPNRRVIAVVDLVDGAPTSRLVEAGWLYDALERALEIDATLVNLEGACVVGDVLRLYQRGNAGGDRIVNASADTELAAVLDVLDRAGDPTGVHLSNVRRYDLGLLDDVPLGFTSADTSDDGTVLFAAAAEASETTYDDGEITGSVIGVLARDGVVASAAPVVADPPLKVEGIAVESVADGAVTLRCVCDRDDPDTAAEAVWLRVTLPVPFPASGGFA